MSLSEKFGIKIRSLRSDRNISQAKLAELSNLDRTYIHSIEKGTRNISIQVAQQLADAFEIELHELFIWQ